MWETTEPVYSSIGVRGRPELGPPLAPPVGRRRRAQLERAAERLEGAPDGALRIVALHHQLSAPVADAEEAGRSSQPCARAARRARRGADPWRTHPPGGRQRASRVRGAGRRAAASSSRSRPASAGPARTGAARRGAARLPRRRALDSRSRRTSGAARAGSPRPSGGSRAAASRCRRPTRRCVGPRDSKLRAAPRR